MIDKEKEELLEKQKMEWLENIGVTKYYDKFGENLFYKYPFSEEEIG